MKLTFRNVMMALLAMGLPLTAGAQENEEGVSSYVDIDLVSHYIWRGMDIGGLSIQPEASVSWKGLLFRIEGSAGFESTDHKEIDVTLGYETHGFNVGIIDYWTSGVDKDDRYFAFEKKGAHQLEANLGYTCKYGSLQAYTMFWGNDFKISGSQAYSTYIELSVPFKLGGVDWTATVAGTPFESAGKQTETTYETNIGTMVETHRDYFYAEGAACVNATLRATKKLDLGKIHLPVFAELNTNPYLQTATVICGVSIIPF